ncbi:MAG: hypothetical protein HY720_30885 [Planctomycetes bacterium]|nr:hypothetical protein [Planctomycetota bacterium]
MAEMKIKVGTKIEPAEAKKLDRGKMGVGTVNKPKEAEVEAQCRFWQQIVCPWCHGVSWCYVDDQVYLWFTCCWCGCSFRA